MQRTHEEIHIRTVAPGFYYHFGLSNQLKKNPHKVIGNIIKLEIDFDYWFASI